MEDLEDLYENAPCGYLSLAADGVIIKANRTLAGWLGTQSFELLGKQFYDLLNVPGKIFYETHFAPLLRMQGYFHEVALDLVGPDGRRLPVWPMPRSAAPATGAFNSRV
ncbi:UNVERIFIED_ORG: PAS domain-containing protein [Rhizobium etli]